LSMREKGSAPRFLEHTIWRDAFALRLVLLQAAMYGSCESPVLNSIFMLK
jgi:hypothetical protein